MERKPYILGLSASLRNSRRIKNDNNVIDELSKIDAVDQLKTFLKNQAKIRLDQFVNSGRKDGLPFNEIYRNLKKQKGNQGLSNSEIALFAALWECVNHDCEVEHISLAEYFLDTKESKNTHELIEKIKKADGLILSTPVYFGDRSSLAQSFINFLAKNKTNIDFKEKVYAGISVGAKRNGGQETTLMYQLYDFVHLGFLGVGNDSDTTSQYGGTGYAGDIGSMADDQYGLEVSMGTGRRLAKISRSLKNDTSNIGLNKLKIQFWILQDANGRAIENVNSLISTLDKSYDVKIIDLCNYTITRCIACDICPTHIDIDQEYRCIIKSKADDLEGLHQEIIDADVIIPVVYSPVNKDDLISNYQSFIERTRYLRRGDYVLSDLIVKPLIIEEVYAEQNMIIRTMTSFLRHHTILHKPLHLLSHNNVMLDFDAKKEVFMKDLEYFKSLTICRLLEYKNEFSNSYYKPVGYILAADKEEEDLKMNARHKMIKQRIEKHNNEIKSRFYNSGKG